MSLCQVDGYRGFADGSLMSGGNNKRQHKSKPDVKAIKLPYLVIT